MRLWPRAPAALLGLFLLAAAPLAAAPVIEGRFTLMDQEGRTVTESVLHGRPALLYFGFTSCPDVCPTDLARIASVAAAVRKQYGIALRPVFITVDPKRDRPKVVKAYVNAFSPDFIGLTGTPAQIADVARQYHVYYKKVPIGDKGAYTMDHSTFVFLLDAKGRYVAHYGRKLTAAQISTAAGTALQARGSDRR